MYLSSLSYAGYHSRAFEFFLRATSHSYFEEPKILLKVQDKEDLVNKYKAGAKRYNVVQWHLGVSLEHLMNLAKLETQ